MTTSAGWFAYVSAAGRPYQNTDTVPAIPWKTDNTNTIILGRITDAAHPNAPVYHDWINKATVNLYHAGPPIINRTVETDPTGYFVLTDVAPKTQDSGYTVTISKAGYATRVFANQAIAGGQVVRIDAELGTWNCTSPPEAVNQAGKALISLPYEPVNPAPVSVFPDIPLHYNLIRWNRPTQGWVTYNQYIPGGFGNLNQDEGYWLKTSAPYTIHYQAYGATTASRTQSLPKAGWNLIGCPFETEHKWADMTLTSGATTYSLQQAKTNGWIPSTKGTWWDSTTQSWKSVGLPTDFPQTTYLKPWHGVYFKTAVDSLQLTQR
jgi:hypothetical protein